MGSFDMIIVTVQENNRKKTKLKLRNYSHGILVYYLSNSCILYSLIINN